VAARRLIIVLVVLFAISIAAAAVAPERRSPSTAVDEPSTSTTDAPGEPPGPSGDSITATIEASADDPQTIRAGVGDQVELIVSARAWLQVGLPDLGLLDEATPDAPARFDVLLRRAGDLAITDAGNGETIGRLLVVEPSGSGETALGSEGGQAE